MSGLRARPKLPRPTRIAASIAAALVAAVLASAFLPGDGTGGPKAGDASRGKGVFSKNCVVCHNADGSGGKKLTPNGNPSRDFRDAKFWSERTDDQIRETINKGVAKSGMIAWKGILKPQEIEDVMAFIKTFAKADPKAKPADQVKIADPKAAGTPPEKNSFTPQGK